MAKKKRLKKSKLKTRRSIMRVASLLIPSRKRKSAKASRRILTKKKAKKVKTVKRRAIARFFRKKKRSGKLRAHKPKITKRKKASRATPKKRRLLAKKRLQKKLRRPKIRKTVIKNKSVQSEVDSIASSFFKARIKVIGIGGGGTSIVSEIGRSLEKAQFVVADTDTRNFKKRPGIKYFLFGQELTHGLGTGLDPNVGRMAAEQEKDRIAKLFEDQDMLIFVASLGGGAGSGATPVFTQIAKEFKGISFGIFTLPFKFEGKNKYKIAAKALLELRKSLNVSITIANEKIFKIIDENTAITDAFSMVNKNLIESLESLIDLIYNPGVINIDFADLKTILGGKGSIAFLNTVQASGKDRIEKISQDLFHNPLYQNPTSDTAKRVLFNIVGGKALSMFEVNKISSLVADRNPKAKIIFGITKNSAYHNKIKVTILMSSSPMIEEKVTPKVEVVKSVKPLKVIDKVGKELIKKLTKKKSIVRKAVPQTKKVKKSSIKEEPPPPEVLVPVSHNVPISVESATQPAAVGVPDSGDMAMFEVDHSKKRAIRRSALEIKKAEELEESRKSKQEKEWEIPAFLRLKK